MKYIVEVPDHLFPNTTPRIVPFDEYRPSWWEEAYGKGVDDAWKAAKNLSLMSPDEAETIFPGAKHWNRFNLGYAGREAVLKITQHEKEKGVSVGDEIVSDDGLKGVVIVVGGDSPYWHVFDERETREILGPDMYKWRKTGRRFPEIAKQLEQLEEKDEGEGPTRMEMGMVWDGGAIVVPKEV